jgi:hypothetical protein
VQGVKSESPAIARIAHLTETPKHLMAIAASKNTAALGYVSSATAKNDDRLWGVLLAERDNRYSPNAEAPPENIQVSMPGMIPAEASA